MNLLFMSNGLPPYGIPRNGLVSIIDPGRQILTGTTGQTLIDYSGHGNTFQLGSAAGSDTNDPAWSGQGLVCTGDDYALSPKLSTFQINQNWTIYLLGLFNGGGTLKNYLGIAKPTEATAISLCIFNVSPGLVIIRNIDDAAADNISTALSVSTTLPTLLTFKSIGGNFTLTNTRTKLSVSTPNNRTTKDSRIGIGCRPVATPAGIIDAMSNYGCLVYNRATTQTEDAQAYNGLRRLMSSRGVVI